MRNTDKLYYPLAESIASILPIIDEMIIALGKGDEDDHTEQIIHALHSNKIKIVHTEWDVHKYQSGTEFAHQTDIAKSFCTGDWLIYLQSDEVIHERYLPTISKYCSYYLDHSEVEGFLFKYKHFFGDYDHHIVSHPWYPREIRIIRNHPKIHSWGDAQSFRYIEEFDGLNYRNHPRARSLKVVEIPAEIYHYGWVRPPDLMQTKSRAMNKMYHDPQKIDEEFDKKAKSLDYGRMCDLDVFKETHPEVMRNFISRFHWKDQLHYDPTYKVSRELMKHEKSKYKFLSWIEKHLLRGNLLFGYRNWKILKDHLT